MRTVTVGIALSPPFISFIDCDIDQSRNIASYSVKGILDSGTKNLRGKKCKVALYRGSHEHLSQFAAKHGIEAACGAARLLPERADEMTEPDGKQGSAEPIEIALWLDSTAYHWTERRFTADREFEITLSLHLQVPDEHFTAESKDRLERYGAFSGVVAAFSSLDDVNLDDGRTYPITSYRFESHRGNAQVLFPKKDIQKGNELLVKFCVMRAEIRPSLWGSALSISTIELFGRAKYGTWSLPARATTVEIQEYQRSQSGYPDEGHPGYCVFAKQGWITECWPVLFATQEGLRTLADFFMSLSGRDAARIDIMVKTDGQRVGLRERKSFDVEWYTPHLFKSYRHHSLW